MMNSVFLWEILHTYSSTSQRARSLSGAYQHWNYHECCPNETTRKFLFIWALSQHPKEHKVYIESSNICRLAPNNLLFSIGAILKINLTQSIAPQIDGPTKLSWLPFTPKKLLLSPLIYSTMFLEIIWSTWPTIPIVPIDKAPNINAEVIKPWALNSQRSYILSTFLKATMIIYIYFSLIIIPVFSSLV